MTSITSTEQTAQTPEQLSMLLAQVAALEKQVQTLNAEKSEVVKQRAELQAQYNELQANLALGLRDSKATLTAFNFSNKRLRPENVPSADNPKQVAAWISNVVKKCCQSENLNLQNLRTLYGRKSEKRTKSKDLHLGSEAKSRRIDPEAKVSPIDAKTAEIEQRLADAIAESTQLAKDVEETTKAQDFILDHLRDLRFQLDVLPQKIDNLKQKLRVLQALKASSADADLSALAENALFADEDLGVSNSSNPSNPSNPSNSSKKRKPVKRRRTSRKRKQSKEENAPKDSPKERTPEEIQNSVKINGMIIPVPDFVNRCPLLVNGKLYNSKMKISQICNNIMICSTEINAMDVVVRQNKGDGMTQDSTIDTASCMALQITNDPENRTPAVNLDDPPVGKCGYDFRLPFVPHISQLADWAAKDPELAALQLKKLALIRDYGFTASLINIMIQDPDGNWTFDPFLLKHTASASIYMQCPAFVGDSNMSLSYLINQTTIYASTLTSKCRAIKTLNMFFNDKLDKATMIKKNNMFNRCYLRGPAKATRHRILQESDVLGIDETPIVVRAHAKLPPAAKKVMARKKSRAWSAVTGPNAKFKGGFFWIAPSREAEELVKNLKCPDRKVPFRYVVCDGCESYPKGLELLNEELREEAQKKGIEFEPVKIALCWQHASRRADRSQRSSGLKELYDAVNAYGIKHRLSFEEAFDYFKEHRKDIPELKNVNRSSYLMMEIRSFIDDLYTLEDTLRHPNPEEDEIAHEDIRPECKNLTPIIFELALELVQGEPSVVYNESTKEWEGSDEGTAANFACYLLNHRENLETFTESEDIPIFNQVCEASMRSIAQARHHCMFIDSNDGCFAFADLMTLISTCEAIGVNPYDYLLWVVLTIKLRIEMYRINKGISYQLLMQYPGLSAKEYEELIKQDPEKAQFGHLYQPDMEESQRNVFDMAFITQYGTDPYTYLMLLTLSAQRYAA